MTALGEDTAWDIRRPLEGVMIADFSRVLAGPLATMTLADLGARVIKVERPGTGDDTRSWGPPFSATGSTYFEGVNRNKESIALDLRSDADLAVARALISRADVVVENFMPGVMARFGLDFETLAAENPGLIYASITGFGSGVGAERPGYDFIVQALGGLMSVTGEELGEPMKVGVALVDVLTSKDATTGILAALHRRNAHGLGAHIEVNLLSSLQAALANQAQAYLGAGVVPGRLGNEHPSIVLYQLLHCADVPLAIACGNDGQFGKLCTVLKLDDLPSDERFRTNDARVRNRVALVALLEAQLREGPAQHWQDRLIAVRVPAGQVSTIPEGVELAESLGLQPTIEVLDDHGAVTGRQIRHPISWTPPFVPQRAAPPALDQHGQSVRRWLDETDATPTAR